tara:strand:- start:2896 stop:3180 length:285 start_codon:yes stop_codon:yes gene_type:complete
MIWILGVFFAISLISNILLAWYIKELLGQFSAVESQFEKMFRDVLYYEEHLESVYNMETFFGEPVLSSLLEHTKDIKKDIEEVRGNFNIFESEE